MAFKKLFPVFPFLCLLAFTLLSLLLLPAAASLPLSYDTSLPLPNPILGTWILQSTSPDTIYGYPLARCDHSMRYLGGAALRKNAAVPFPTSNGAPPAVDPFNNTLWIFGGHENAVRGIEEEGGNFFKEKKELEWGQSRQYFGSAY